MAKLIGRLFFDFPAGLPGMSLLLLRAVLGLAILTRGGLCVEQPHPSPLVWLVGASAFLAGTFLTVGFLTPLAGAAIAAGAAGMWFSLLPVCATTGADSTTSLMFGCAILAAVVGLGPGAFSVDARLFGRREIIIPLSR